MQRTLLRDERGGILATLHIQDNGDVIIMTKTFIIRAGISQKTILRLTKTGVMSAGAI